MEALEDRRLLAITWANEFGTGSENPDFGIYGTNEIYAREIVNRAIKDWSAVITDFNFDGDNNPATSNSLNNTYSLHIFCCGTSRN